MDRELKDPIVVDGVPLYTLCSYEPVAVTVAVRPIGEREIDAAVMGALGGEGAYASKMRDSKWIHERFPFAHNIDEVRDYYRDKLNKTNEEVVAERKLKECINALADRLQQRVLQSDITLARQKMQQVFMEGLKKNGVDLNGFKRKFKKTDEDIQGWFDSLSVVFSRQLAAIGAFSRYRGITVTDDEIAAHLAKEIKKTGTTVTDAMNQIRAQGRLGELRLAMTNSKAVKQIMDESKFTYDYSKPIDRYDRIYGYPSIHLF